MNSIIRSLLYNGNVSLAVMDTTRLVNDAIAIHKTNCRASSILGSLLTCAAYMGSCLKDKGSISITVKAKEGDGAVSVSCDGDLHVRGYADGSCTQTLAGGSLTVVREERGSAMPFVGTCEISGDDISDALGAYFQQSEQIPTAVCIVCEMGADGGCLYAGGVIMQLLPDADEGAIEQASKAFDNFCNNRDALFEFGAKGVYQKFFSSADASDCYELSPQYKCNCSERKIAGLLASLGKEELKKIIREQGVVSVHCHYCNKDYVYDSEKIEELFKS